jgi:hypothetical protein
MLLLLLLLLLCLSLPQEAGRDDRRWSSMNCTNCAACHLRACTFS